MTDYTLRCDEVLESPSGAGGVGAGLPLFVGDPPHFCRAIPDRAILHDDRVMSNMLALEGCYIPDLDWSYMRQSEIRLHMRKTVAEWMLDVCVDQACQSDVFLLSTNIMDRFLGTIILQKEQFQLLGAACIFLASKMIEPRPISATALVKSTADTYDKDELLQMELLILSKLKWDLTAVTAYDYLDHLMNTVSSMHFSHQSEEGDLHHPHHHQSTSQQQQSEGSGASGGGAWDRETTHTIRNLTERIVLLCATDSEFATISPSLIASAAFVAAVQNSPSYTNRSVRKEVNLNHVTAQLESVAKFDKESLRECVNKIEAMIRNGQSHCESPDKAKGQSVVEEDDDDEEGPPGPTMTSTPIKSAESGASSSSNGQGNREEQQAALSGDKSNSTTSSSRRAVPGKSASGGYSIQDGSMEVDVSTPTEMYKVSAYCVT